ncbi:hypothetical protein [Salinactinospora qingdaonensis]|uniref:hypothetical protein n=1 Tax=Salinactinospora qingdaonensis TaxID=702744 RepID=UPI0031E99365
MADSQDSAAEDDDAVLTGESECEADPLCSVIGGAAAEAETAEVAAVDPAAVADDARDSLRLPPPRLAASPPLDQPVLVRVPMWLWVGEETWRAHSARAAVPGGAVSVTATPVRAHWAMGDGTTVACAGPGVAYNPQVHDPAAASPACGHTYTRASAGQPQGTYALGVEVTWAVSWQSSDGGGGTLDPLVTAAGAEVEVVESQALVETTS